jgi:glycine cleavage system H protein
MSFEVPEDRQYLATHEWVHRGDDSVRIGISDFAQDELGDVVFVEFPAVGEELQANEEFGVIESIKAVSDLYAPISGEVTATNDDLLDAPELVNDDPYGEGWMIELGPADDAEFDDLLSATGYREQVE